jgi:hypothetical protein
VRRSPSSDLRLERARLDVRLSLERLLVWCCRCSVFSDDAVLLNESGSERASDGKNDGGGLDCGTSHVYPELAISSHGSYGGDCCALLRRGISSDSVVLWSWIFVGSMTASVST